MKVAQETPQLGADDRLSTLIQMGGKRKRKPPQTNQTDAYHPDHKVPDNELHTPVPNANTGRYYVGKKRKRNNSPQNKQVPNQNQKPVAGPRQNQNTNRRGRSRNFNNRKSPPKDHCKAFDYGKVDYQQFQGGSARVNTGQNVQTKFRGKVSDSAQNSNIIE